jgi:hypothetical protein
MLPTHGGTDDAYDEQHDDDRHYHAEDPRQPSLPFGLVVSGVSVIRSSTASRGS